MNDQRSTTDQLRDAVRWCNEAGMYDAADWIRRELEDWGTTCSECGHGQAAHNPAGGCFGHRSIYAGSHPESRNKCGCTGLLDPAIRRQAMPTEDREKRCS